MAEIQLDYAVPAADLVDYKTLFYCFRADVPMFEDVERADHAQVRFRLSSGDASYRFHDGTVQQPVATDIIGPTSGPITVRVAGPVRVFGMGLTAAGWTALIGSEASSALDRVIDANTVFGAARLRAAATALAAADNLTASVAIGEALVRDLLRGADPGINRFIRQIDDWWAASPSPDIANLVAMTGLSRRQIERRCNAAYGAPPKLLARKYRALRAASSLASEAVDIDDVIARGFYDQSHLIREMKEFTGLTSRQISAQPGALRHLTIARRSALGGQVSPLVSDT